jgi:hypothetical protein
MKTDFVEIFQTIRAALQPYATLGFSNRVNSETVYELWSDKNVVIEGRKRTEVFFCQCRRSKKSRWILLYASLC